MTYGHAIAVIKSLNSPDPEADVMEKAEAIHKILSMETINSVTKQDLLRCVKWLWNRCFELEEAQP